MLARFQFSVSQHFRISRVAACLVVALIAVCCSNHSYGQFAGGGGIILGGVGGVVGGVEIDTDGVLSDKAIRLSDDIRVQIEDGLKSVDSNVNKRGLRMISLKALERKMLECKNNGTAFPPELLYMAGLQRIEYVLITPEKDDIIIAGPGEGFTTNAAGNVVGARSGMPVIHLQDFLIAMRYVDSARQGYGISVSIDPTEAGIHRIQQVMRRLTAGNFDEHAARALEEAGGPQVISLTGVPKDSRFSQVLVSADYKMKRLAMGLEESPDFLPSILAMAQRKDSNFRKMTPRFWMACNYQPVAVSDDKTIWKLNGQGVRAETEEEFLQKDGTRSVEKPHKLARKWADTMTSQFDELSQVQPVFRELRNMMDLSVVAAIISREKLLQKTNLDIPAIQGLDTIATPKFNVPKSVPTQCSFARLSRSMMVTTSGGVTIDSWSVASNTATDSKLSSFAEKAISGRSDNWWWNAN